MGRNWQLVWFGGESTDPAYLNKRAQMWGAVRDWLKAGGAIDPNDNALYDDLIGPETVDATGKNLGKIQLESKKDMKKRGLPSPGRGDALALSFAFPVVSRAMRAERGVADRMRDRERREHNPFQFKR